MRRDKTEMGSGKGDESPTGIEGIDRLISVSSEGGCTVNVEILTDHPIDRALADIKNNVDALDSFPEEAEKPVIQEVLVRRGVIQIAISGDTDERSLRRIGERVRDELTQKPGITQVELGRVPDYVTHVEIPSATLREYGLTLGDVADTIEQSSRDVAAGSIDTSGGEILLRINERRLWSEQLSDIVVVSSDSGAPVRLGDIAHVEDGFEEQGFLDKDLARAMQVPKEVKNSDKEKKVEAENVIPDINS